jgi:hypothetical protein
MGRLEKGKKNWTVFRPVHLKDPMIKQCLTQPSPILTKKMKRNEATVFNKNVM